MDITDGVRRDLVEPEGVNAGSARSTAEGPHPIGDVRSGGHPEAAAEQAERETEHQIVDAPFEPRDATAPSLEQSEEEGAR